MALLIACAELALVNQPDPRSHQGACACGWVGLRRTYRIDAEQDLAEHQAGLR